MPETRLTSFPTLSVYPRFGISRSASETNVRFYLDLSELILIEKSGRNEKSRVVPIDIVSIHPKLTTLVHNVETRLNQR